MTRPVRDPRFVCVLGSSVRENRKRVRGDGPYGKEKSDCLRVESEVSGWFTVEEPFAPDGRNYSEVKDLDEKVCLG